MADQHLLFHAAVIDIRLDDADKDNEDGLRLLALLKRQSLYTNAIVVTGYPTLRTQKKSLRELLVFDYIEKYPEVGETFNYKSFRNLVRQAVDQAEQKRLTHSS